MSDFLVQPFSFNQTTVTFVANNDSAKNRIYGGVSVEIKMSEAQRFFATLIGDGFTVEIK